MTGPYTKHVLTLFLGAIFIFALWELSAPSNFPKGQIITVAEGQSLKQISTNLAEEGVVRSAFWFKIFARVLGGERGMQAGQYFLGSKESAPKMAWRIARGIHDIETVKLTVPEGFTLEKISSLFDKKFPFFDHTYFERSAPEGYLFPDTYFVPVTATATSTIKLMRENFDRKLTPLSMDIVESGKTLGQIVTMASLLEAEAKTEVDRKMVADVLWKRLKLGMPLQVDSEMGTYTFQGLPEKPINNPGLVSISAAIHPTTTPYLYFLSDKKSVMHYARNFDEHQANIAKYLQ